MLKLIPLEPVPAPRMSRSDAWNKRPCVIAYREYQNNLKLFCDKLPKRLRVVFGLPFPKSYSRKKRDRLIGQPHLLKPDADNLLKGLQDGIYYGVTGGDSHIHEVWHSKVWATDGFILVADMDAWPLDVLPTNKLVPRPLLYSLEDGEPYLMVG